MSKQTKRLPKSKENTQSSLQVNLIERAETSASAATPADRSELRDQYAATGNFTKDYAELCNRFGIERPPLIVPRGRRPVTPTAAPAEVVHTSTKETTTKGKDKKLQAQHEKEKESKDKRKQGSSPFAKEDSDLKEAEALNTGEWKTFSVRDTWAYMKPVIQIESDSVMPETNRRQHDVEPVEVVNEVYITGWKVEAPMMEVFRLAWPSLEKLHTITFWNVGLTGETVNLLAEKLSSFVSLKSLILDGNAQNTEQNFHLLISQKNTCNLQKLSLRHCAITDRGAELLAESLCTFTVEQPIANTKLISLNLAGNRISDRGAACLARALRFNRTLLMLTLSDNLIGDVGAHAFAVTISKFPLEHFEICERRRILAKRRELLAATIASTMPTVHAKRGNTTATGGRSTSMSRNVDRNVRKKDTPDTKKGGKNDKEKEKSSGSLTKNAKDDKPAVDHAGKKNLQASIGASTGNKAGAVKGTGREKKTSVITPVTIEPVEVQKEDKGPLPPLLDDLTAENDPERAYLPWLLENNQLVSPAAREDPERFISPYDIIVRGNYCLANLNLSRNRIGKLGMEILLAAVKYQSTALQMMPNSLLNYSASNPLPDLQLLVCGLLRLTISGNSAPSSDNAFRELIDLMSTKDVFVQQLARKQGNMLLGGSGTATSMSFAQAPSEQANSPSPLTPVPSTDERQI